MEIKITSKQVLNVLNVFSWIIFIGLCIEAGGLIFNTFFSLLYNPLGASQFWEQIDFFGLFNYDKGHFITETVLMIIVAVLKAIMFYVIIKNMDSKKLDLAKPFKKEFGQFIQNLCYLALGISLFSHWGARYTKWLTEFGIKMPDIQQLNFAGADVWLFMGVTLLVIAQIFKRGIEIQDENDLIL